MNASSLAATLFWTALLVGGCLRPGPTGAAESAERDAESSALAASAGGGGASGPEKADGKVRAIPVRSVWNEAPTGFGGSCGLTMAGACEEYIADHVVFTGTLSGQALGVEHSHVDASSPDKIKFEKDPFIFVGSIADCGTGMLAFHVSGWFYRGPQGLHANETLSLIQGTTSTGLAGIVDAKVYMDAPMGSAGLILPLTGTVWCR